MLEAQVMRHLQRQVVHGGRVRGVAGWWVGVEEGLEGGGLRVRVGGWEAHFRKVRVEWVGGVGFTSSCPG